jgi:choline dehydrogenase-like flavoprotein
MNPIIVVGSGASGVHFALAALRKGRRVVMLDVGHTGQEVVRPDDSLNGLKQNLPDPVGYFLGPRYESLVLPGSTGESHAIPPSKDYVFRAPPEFQYEANGFSPLFSFAAGGLAEAWTGGCYPFNDRELRAFPFGYEELAPFYAKVSAQIGITGADDDLAAALPFHGGLMEPLELDDHSAFLLEAYKRRRSYLNEKLGCLMGRARVAALSRALGSRKRCGYLGRCLWGCPGGAFYTPSLTLAECLAFPGFRYHAGLYVDHFRMDNNGSVRSVVAYSAGGQTHEFPAGSLVLAAGTLCSAKIFLESMHREAGKALELRGVMDNRQILMPFVNLRMLGRRWSADSYQFHQVAMTVQPSDTGEYVLGLVTTLKTAMIHPLVPTLPFDLGTSVSAFRNVHSALGMVNINLPDHRRDENYVTLDVSSRPHRLIIHYRPESAEPERLKHTIATFRKVLWKLGCFAPSRTVHVRPMGASVHYAGTLPMTDKPTSLACSKHCQSHDVENLYFADGSTFPDLPAKNLTFTLMANATRIAEEAF